MKSSRPAFTLVELLVVMSIIAILAAMLMPAIVSVQVTARRTECAHRMRNVALALVQHDSVCGNLPGYQGFRDPLARTGRISWVFPTLPYLERNDIFRAYGPAGRFAASQPKEHVPVLVCPVDGTARTGTGFSYVVNTGRPGDNDTLASAVFHSGTVDRPLKNSLAIISAADGAAQTLLLSENVDAGRWTDSREGLVGFCFKDGRVPASDWARINIGIGKEGRWHASSYHRGSVVVAFCDAHVKPLDENLDYRVWRLLFTPAGEKAGQPQLLNEELLGSF